MHYQVQILSYRKWQPLQNVSKITYNSVSDKLPRMFYGKKTVEKQGFLLETHDANFYFRLITFL